MSLNVKVGKNLGNTRTSMGNNTSGQAFGASLPIEQKLTKQAKGADIDIDDIERELDSAERSRISTHKLS